MMDQLMDQSSGLPKNKVIAVFVGVVLLAGTGAFWKLSVDNQTASLTQQAMSSTQRLTVAEQTVRRLEEQLRERDEELLALRSQSEKLSKDAKRHNQVVDKQKDAAKKLAELLANVQKERDRYRTDVEVLSRPDSLPCIEAIQAKDNAIAALLGERAIADKAVAQLKGQLKKEERKREDISATLQAREAEVDKLSVWKDEAAREMQRLQRHAVSSSIWAASIDSAKPTSQCPKPIPPFLQVDHLAQLLEVEEAKSAVEIGCSDAGHSAELLKRWPSAANFLCIAGNDDAPTSVFRKDMESMRTKVSFVSNLTDEVVSQWKDDSLDLVHLAVNFNHPVYYEETLSSVLEQMWLKLRVGGILVGGVVRYEEAASREEKSAALTAVELFARHKHRQMARFGVATWAIRR